MALEKVKPNHAGAKNGDKIGKRAVVKASARKLRRQDSALLCRSAKRERS